MNANLTYAERNSMKRVISRRTCEFTLGSHLSSAPSTAARSHSKPKDTSMTILKNTLTSSTFSLFYIYFKIRPHECHVCNVKFERASTLKIHLHVHQDEKPFECKVCLKKFKEKGNMKTHVKTHEKKERKPILHFSADGKLFS